MHSEQTSSIAILAPRGGRAANYFMRTPIARLWIRDIRAAQRSRTRHVVVSFGASPLGFTSCLESIYEADDNADGVDSVDSITIVRVRAVRSVETWMEKVGNHSPINLIFIQTLLPGGGIQTG